MTDKKSKTTKKKKTKASRRKPTESPGAPAESPGVPEEDPGDILEKALAEFDGTDTPEEANLPTERLTPAEAARLARARPQYGQGGLTEEERARLRLAVDPTRRTRRGQLESFPSTSAFLQAHGLPPGSFRGEAAFGDHEANSGGGGGAAEGHPTAARRKAAVVPGKPVEVPGKPVAKPALKLNVELRVVAGQRTTGPRSRVVWTRLQEPDFWTRRMNGQRKVGDPDVVVTFAKLDEAGLNLLAEAVEAEEN